MLRTPGTVFLPTFALLFALLSCGSAPSGSQTGTAAADAASERAAEAPGQAQETLDEEARTRLQGLFDRIDALSGVEVAVEAGVARLTGEAFSLEAREEAVRLARETEGVVYVEDRMRVETDLAERLGPTLERIRDYAVGAVAFLPLLVVALATVALFTATGRFLAAWEGGPHLRWTENPFLRGVARQGVVVLFVVTGALVALELLDATALVGAVLGAAGVFGLAVGFAFKDIVENHLAGVILSLRRPFEPNDLVLLGGHEGKLVRLTARETILMTPAGNHVRIPNAEVFRSVMVNYTRNKRRRFDFPVSVGPSDDLTLAQEVGRAALAGMTGVLEDPPPTSRVVELGDSWVTLHFFGWVDQDSADFGRVRSEAIRAVKHALEDADVTMPSPEYSLVMNEPPTPTADAPEERPAAEVGPSPATEPPGGVELAQEDVSVDRTLDEQIDEDRRSSDEEDLLSGSESG